MFTYTVEGWRGYAVSICLVVLATAVRASVGLVDQHVAPFATYFPAILFATLIAGWRAGTFALVLSAVTAWFVVMPPALSFAAREPVANLSLFLMCGGLIVWLADAYRSLVKSMQEADAQRNLLIQEMAHRSRNITAVVETIIRNSLKPDDEKSEKVMGRLRTLLNSEVLFADKTASGERLHKILRESLMPHGNERILVKGEDVIIDPKSARSWALIIHELATNAAKYGALANNEGTLQVVWTVEEDEVLLQWLERGSKGKGNGNGNGNADMSSTGFGTKLIEVSVRSLGGTVEREFASEGLRCVIRAPIRRAGQPPN